MSGNDSLSQASSPSIITSSASKAFWINMDFSSWYVRQWFIVSSVFPQHHYQFCFRGRMIAWWLTTAGVSILSEWSLCHCILCKVPATHRGTRTSLALLFMACPAWFIVPSVFPQYHGLLCFRGRIRTWQVTTAGVSILSEWSLCHCILCKPLATHRGTTMLHCVFDTFITSPDNFPRIRSDFSMVTHGDMALMTPPELWGIWQGSVLVFPTPTTPPELLGPGTPPGPPPPTPPEAFGPGTPPGPPPTTSTPTTPPEA